MNNLPKSDITPAPNTLSPADREKLIEHVISLDSFNYDLQRKQLAQRLGVRVTTLDDLRQAHIKVSPNAPNGVVEVVENLEPWHYHVDGGELAEEILFNLNRYAVLPDGADIAITLWIFGSYTIDSFRIFPKLYITSPEKRCGKSTVLEVLSALVFREITTSNISEAAIFRMISQYQPTLMIDEADTFLHENHIMTGIINSGHKKSGARVIRCDGDDHEPKAFSTWTPMVIAGIGTPKDTILDRSIVVELRRKLDSESVDRMPVDIKPNYIDIRRRCLRWANDNAGALKDLELKHPDLGNDRAEDNWLTLLAIASMLGDKWIQRAHIASLLLNREEKSEDVKTLLLSDVRDIFDKLNQRTLFSDELVDELIAIEEHPWAEWKRGKPMTKTSLSKLLSHYKIKPKQLRKGNDNRRGYALADFEDVFTRYLPSQSVTTLHAGYSGLS